MILRPVVVTLLTHTMMKIRMITLTATHIGLILIVENLPTTNLPMINTYAKPAHNNREALYEILDCILAEYGRLTA